MSQIKGWYYLHVNGDVIFKHDMPGIPADIRESDLAVGLWCLTGDRESAWGILVECLAALKGKSFDTDREARIFELAGKWECDDDDAKTYAERIGVLLNLDGNKWCATRRDFENLQESPAGFGDTCLEAMADLANALGYKPSKIWGVKFSDLTKIESKQASK